MVGSSLIAGIIALGGGALQPEARVLDIRGDAASREIHLGEIELRPLVPAFGGRLHPFEGEGVVLGDAPAQPVHRGEPVLRFRISRLGAAAKDRRRRGEVASPNGTVRGMRRAGCVLRRRGTGTERRDEQGAREPRPLRPRWCHIWFPR
jgi:hypothetical protein